MNIKVVYRLYIDGVTRCNRYLATAYTIADVQRGIARYRDYGGSAAQRFTVQAEVKCIATRHGECTAQLRAVGQIYIGDVVGICNIARAVPCRPYGRCCVVNVPAGRH